MRIAATISVKTELPLGPTVGTMTVQSLDVIFSFPIASIGLYLNQKKMLTMIRQYLNTSRLKNQTKARSLTFWTKADVPRRKIAGIECARRRREEMKGGGFGR